MKNLLRKISYAICIVLLTCTFCLAQPKNKVTTFEHGIIYFNGSEQKSDGSDTTIIELMIEYETECYNDSAYVEYFRYHESPSTTDSITGLSIVSGIYISPTLIKEWQHKEPTFKDFVRWVANKYGL